MKVAEMADRGLAALARRPVMDDPARAQGPILADPHGAPALRHVAQFGDHDRTDNDLHVAGAARDRPTHDRFHPDTVPQTTGV